MGSRCTSFTHRVLSSIGALFWRSPPRSTEGSPTTGIVTMGVTSYLPANVRSEMSSGPQRSAVIGTKAATVAIAMTDGVYCSVDTDPLCTLATLQDLGKSGADALDRHTG